MVHDKVIYTDGHEVMVTGTHLQVKRGAYRLEGITNHGLQKVSPRRWPGMLLILLGFILSVAGYFKVFPTSLVTAIQFNKFVMPAYTVVMLSGSVIMLMGVLVVGLIKDRYAVRIETAEGEKDVVVSTQQEYVQLINEALNKALDTKSSSRMKVA